MTEKLTKTIKETSGKTLNLATRSLSRGILSQRKPNETRTRTPIELSPRTPILSVEVSSSGPTQPAEDQEDDEPGPTLIQHTPDHTRPLYYTPPKSRKTGQLPKPQKQIPKNPSKLSPKTLREREQELNTCDLAREEFNVLSEITTITENQEQEVQNLEQDQVQNLEQDQVQNLEQDRVQNLEQEYQEQLQELEQEPVHEQMQEPVHEHMQEMEQELEQEQLQELEQEKVQELVQEMEQEQAQEMEQELKHEKILTHIEGWPYPKV